MIEKKKLEQVGVLSAGTTDSQRDMQSTNVGQSSMSVTLASTVQKSQNSQVTPNSLPNPIQTYARIISVFATKLGALAEWRKIELGDGRTGYALFFDEKKWTINPVSIELTPLGTEK